MKSVLDASVAVKWVLTETDSDKAIRLRDAYRLQQHELIAPDWLLLEVINVLGKATARKKISPAEARQAYGQIIQDAPAWYPSMPLLDEAFTYALLHQRAAYDCLYLALAIQEGCQLITADEAFVRQLQPIYGCLVALSSLP